MSIILIEEEKGVACWKRSKAMQNILAPSVHDLVNCKKNVNFHLYPNTIAALLKLALSLCLLLLNQLTITLCALFFSSLHLIVSSSHHLIISSYSQHFYLNVIINILTIILLQFILWVSSSVHIHHKHHHHHVNSSNLVRLDLLHQLVFC